MYITHDKDGNPCVVCNSYTEALRLAGIGEYLERRYVLITKDARGKMSISGNIDERAIDQWLHQAKEMRDTGARPKGDT